MKFEIYKEEKTQKKVRLRLIQEVTGMIDLVAVNSEGEVLGKGYLLTIDSFGIELSDAVDPTLGISLDKNGRVKVIK